MTDHEPRSVLRARALDRVNYDAIVLGGGAAGIVCGVAMGGLGLRVLLVERDRLGGECLHTGCVPSKALIHAAKVADTMRRAGRFGIPPAALGRADLHGVLARVRESVREVGDANATEAFLRKQGVEIRFGDARFVSPDAIEFTPRGSVGGGSGAADSSAAVGRPLVGVTTAEAKTPASPVAAPEARDVAPGARDVSTEARDRELLTADHFVLCTGSSPRGLVVPGIDFVRVLTNRTLFDLDEIPESLLVVGGGPVGVEMAQAFGRLGSRVTLVHRGPRILPKDDEELVVELEGVLRAEGVDLRLSAEIVRFERGAEGAVAVARSADGEEARIPCEAVLVAVGRRPNVEGLDLERAGVEWDDRGVKVDGALHTAGRRVWACGDAIGRGAFSHIAEYEAKLVARSIFVGGPAAVRARARYEVMPWATFTDPELASVGLTEAEAQARGLRPIVLRQPFAQDDRALVEGEGRGLVKLVVAPGLRGKLLGAQILGPRAGELIQEFTLALEQGLGVRDIADSIHVYPTLSMACQHAAQRGYERMGDDPRVRRALSAYRSARPLLPGLAAGALVGLGALGAWAVVRGRRKEASD